MRTEPDRGVLSEAQQARVEALRASRSVQQHTAGSAFAGTNPPEVTNLVAVAQFILTGSNPWATQTEASESEQQGNP